MSRRFEQMERPEINAFGLQNYEIRDVLADREIEAIIQAMFQSSFRRFGITDERLDTIMKECFNFARTYKNVTEYEQSAHAVLAREGVTEAIPDRFNVRARIMRDQIEPYLLAGSVLDLGCGDAVLAKLLARSGFALQLADVYQNLKVANLGLPFQLLRQGEAVPFADNQFDNTLLLTVLHHSDDPAQVLRETYRVTRPNGRVIVIESVYGVNGQELPPAWRAQAQPYIALTPEQQRKINIFFDHFYNCIFHYSEDPAQKINVPFNFNTPDGWKQLFEQTRLKQERTVHLGIDHPIVPEYHILCVLTADK